MTSFNDEMGQYVKRIDAALNHFYPEIEGAQATISKAARYSLLAGGKRIRPVLCLATGVLFNASIENLLPFACAIEMIHTFSLIHDDLPGMDNDDFRRGVPTCHKIFGEGIAILAGDALLNKAYEIILDNCAKQPMNGKLEAAREIAFATGDRGMIGGQVIDLESENQNIDYELLRNMHLMKTGALIKAPVLAACHIAQADSDERQCMEQYAESIGLAFQIKDDILDVVSDSKSMGKTVGKDVRSGKSTYISLFGLEKAQIMLSDATKTAYLKLNEIESKGYDVEFLQNMTSFLLERKH